MAMLPTSTAHLVLKQLSIEDLDDTAIKTVDFCLRGFTETLSEDDEYVREGVARTRRRFGIAKEIPIISDLSSARRYAGDRSLGRSKYHSVCIDASGNDCGTLVRELEAYLNPTKSGVVTIIDPTLPEHRGKVPDWLRGKNLAELLLLFPPIFGRPHPFAQQFATQAFSPYVTLPLRIAKVEIANALDLRDPKVASWFARNLTRLNWSSLVPQLGGVNLRAFPFKPALNSWSELLPSMLCQSIGGGRGVTQVAGTWLRKLGVSGLVFPSARSDCSVSIEHNELRDWSGFNFVDYRDAPLGEVTLIVDVSIDWPRHPQTWPDDWTEDPEIVVYDTVSISSVDAGPARGSWSVHGLETRRAAMQRFLEACWLLERLSKPSDSDIRNTKGLLYAFLQGTWRPELAHDFVNALMGVRSAREKILRFVDSNQFDRDIEVRASVRRVLQKAEDIHYGASKD